MAEILGRERRRRWSEADKAKIVADSFRPGVSVSWVARRHGVSTSQLFNWRKAVRPGGAIERAPDFIPVVVGAPCAAPMPPPAEADDRALVNGADGETRIEIAFPNGRRLLAPAGLDRRLLDQLIQSVAHG